MGKIKITCTKAQKQALLRSIICHNEFGCPFDNECPENGCPQCVEENIDFTIIKEDKA